MGRLINGEWVKDAAQVDHDDGEYDRVETTFRDWIGGADVKDGGSPSEEAKFLPETNRYHLYISKACPWCHRCTILRELKGLHDFVSVDVLDPVRRGDGWEFTPEKHGCTDDSIFGHEYLRDIYTEAAPDFTGRPTAPVLYDTERNTIVNNESAEIMRMFDLSFDGHGAKSGSLYPSRQQDTVDQVLSELYEPINNGVTRAGFAETQSAYNDAVRNLFGALEYWNDVLANQRYLAGDTLTEADVAMFTTLYRFDEGYHTNFKVNKHRITDYEHLWPYIRDIYQTGGVAKTCDMNHVKDNFYRSEGHKNPDGIVPVGPDPDFEKPHLRHELGGSE
jgi:putative glutathione S-transferase